MSGEPKLGSDHFPEPGAKAEWLILLILASAQFTNIVDFMVVMPLGPQLGRVLEISPRQFGLIVSVYTIAAGLAGFAGSSFLDRFGRKTVFLSLYGGFLFGTLLCGLAGGYLSLLAARMATGAFGGILGGMSLAIIGDIFPESRRGRATGILMSAFAVASVLGVPTGIYLGTRFGWNTPFYVLAALGAPILVVAIAVLPPLREHVGRGPHASPLGRLVETFLSPDHLRAFALTSTIMLGGFSVIPYISMSLVSNAGVPEEKLPWVFVSGGLLTLFGSPLIGRLADRYGKPRIYRIVAVVSLPLMLGLTNLGRVPLAISIVLPACFMLTNAGRMVAALALVTSSVAPHRRGGFMSANSAVQHLSSGLGAFLGSLILSQPSPDGPLLNYGYVGLFSLIATGTSLWLVGRVHPATAATAEQTDRSSVPAVPAAAVTD